MPPGRVHAPQRPVIIHPAQWRSSAQARHKVVDLTLRRDDLGCFELRQVKPSRKNAVYSWIFRTTRSVSSTTFRPRASFKSFFLVTKS